LANEVADELEILYVIEEFQLHKCLILRFDSLVQGFLHVIDGLGLFERKFLWYSSLICRVMHDYIRVVDKRQRLLRGRGFCSGRCLLDN